MVHKIKHMNTPLRDEDSKKTHTNQRNRLLKSNIKINELKGPSQWKPNMGLHKKTHYVWLT